MTDRHCKCVRKESLNKIHAAKKNNKDSNQLELSQLLQGVMRDKISLLPVEQHFLKLKTLPSSSNLSPRKESKTRQADIEFYRSQKHV